MESINKTNLYPSPRPDVFKICVGYSHRCRFNLCGQKSGQTVQITGKQIVVKYFGKDYGVTRKRGFLLLFTAVPLGKLKITTRKVFKTTS